MRRSRSRATSTPSTACWYAQAALQGKTFTAGPTDHNSNIVDIGNGNLEDQLPGPLVTKANVDDKSLWANNQ